MDRLLGWLRITARRGWQLGGVAVGFFVLWTLFQRLLLLVLTAFLAVLLAVLLTPVAGWLEERGVPRTGATLLAVGGGALLLVGVVGLLVMQYADRLPQLAGELQDVRRSLTAWLTQGPLDLTEQQIQQSIDRVVEAARGSWAAILDQAVAVVTAVGALLTAVIVAFFLVRDVEEITGWVLTRLVADEQRELVRAAGRRAAETLHGFARATVIIGLVDALLIGAGLFLLGVPLAGPLAVLTFLGGLFPVVGATVAGLLATVVAAASGGLVHGLVVLGLVIVVQQVDGNVLQPVVMGNAVHLHPIVVIGALTAGWLLAGLAGAFMAVPTTAVVAAVVGEVRERRGREAFKAEEADRSPSFVG